MSLLSKIQMTLYTYQCKGFQMGQSSGILFKEVTTFQTQRCPLIEVSYCIYSAQTEVIACIRDGSCGLSFLMTELCSSVMRKTWLWNYLWWQVTLFQAATEYIVLLYPALPHFPFHCSCMDRPETGRVGYT